MKQLTLMVPEETYELFDEFEHAARSHADIPNKQGWKSQFGREILNAGIEQKVDESSDYIEILPDSALRNYKVRRVKEQQKREKKNEYMKGGWQDYCRSELDRMLGGKYPHDPERASRIMDGHRAEMEIMFGDEPAERERMGEWLDEQLGIYEAAFWAVEHADDVSTEVNPDDVEERYEVGEGIYRLRENIEDVVEHIRTVADGKSGWDSDAVIDSVANQWTVSRGAAHLLIESLTSDGASIQEALSLGHDRVRSAEDLALDPAGPDAALPETDVVERVTSGEASTRKREDGTVVVVDEDGATAVDGVEDGEILKVARDRLRQGSSQEAVIGLLVREYDLQKQRAQQVVEQLAETLKQQDQKRAEDASETPTPVVDADGVAHDSHASYDAESTDEMDSDGREVSGEEADLYSSTHAEAIGDGGEVSD